MAIYPTLFRKDAKGEVRLWRMEDNGLGQYRTQHGLDSSADWVSSEWTQCLGKNLGKKNETTPIQQALKEVEAEYTKKLARKYARSVDALDDKTIIWPMLAPSKGWDGKLKDGVQYFCQPKLDGIRCLAYLLDGKVVLQSREGKFFENLGHITEALEGLLKAFPTTVLDGELYNHEYRDDFNAIVSGVKGGDLAQAGLIQYHVYDCVPRGPDRFSWRSSWLRSVIMRLTTLPIVWVQTHQVSSRLTLDGLFEDYLRQGYEGQMLRLDGPYEEGKRSRCLQKRKEFQDAEFPVVAIEEGIGNWQGYAKKATLRLPDGRTFGAGIKGNRAALKALLALWNASKHDPEFHMEATVKFFRLTPDGIPRFPVGKAFWQGKRDV